MSGEPAVPRVRWTGRVVIRPSMTLESVFRSSATRTSVIHIRSSVIDAAVAA